MRQVIVTKNAPPATGPFSQAIKHGNLLFTAGQIHLTPEGKLIDGSIEDKTHQVMSNLKNILQQADASLTDVVKTTIYITDMADYPKINEVYGSYFSTSFPARETVCVKELPLGASVEISMVAVIEDEEGGCCGGGCCDGHGDHHEHHHDH
jgi:2-iminobutanoate/2-iminopropanoate deaminase